MTAPLLSNSWYRVAALRPRLRTHARLHRHRYRGELWYVLQDKASGRSLRFTPGARLVIAAMDGKRSVEQLWELANRHLGEDAPSQDEMIQLLGQLHSADLLQSDVTPDVAELFERGERNTKALRRRSYANPMAVRIPLLDPDAFLDRYEALNRFLWGPWGALLWLAVVLPALILLPSHWPELSHSFSDRVLATENLLLLGLVFPVIKALHELGHASATKAGGGEVHDMGVMLLVLLPVPYVDASAASVFRSKYRRAVVGAAGMLVELFVAALAFYLWLMVEPGQVHALAFNAMLIAGVSTLLFNGNPLLRYDAYYILSDLIEIPNLSQRALAYWRYLLERFLLGVEDAETPETTPAEKAWLFFYGVASSIYRIFVTVAIALFIAGKFFVIGVLLAIWAVFAMAVLPLLKGLRYLVGNEKLGRHRWRATGAVGALLVLLLGLIFVLPVPYRTQAEGVVWLSDQALVRAAGSGFLKDFLVQPGTRVTEGEVLARLRNPDIERDLRLAQGRVGELEARYALYFVSDLPKAMVVREQLTAERAKLARVRERAQALEIRSGSGGVFMAKDGADMPGRYYKEGDLLGYVTGATLPTIRVVVSQADVEQVSEATRDVQLRFSQSLVDTAQGRIARMVPAGDQHLPSRALTPEGGGRIAIDPRDSNGTKTLERTFQFDVVLAQPGDISLFGQRVFVRFDHPMKPIGLQWYAGLRRLFLERFHV